jgi:hypothetical protein
MKVEGSNFPPPASKEVLLSLKRIFPDDMPADYLAFMERSNGCQIWFEDDGSSDFDCIRIYSASLLTDLYASHRELFPSLIVIGGDQGSQSMGYDISAGAPWPIVIHLPGWGSTRIADSFTDLENRYFRAVGENVHR